MGMVPSEITTMINPDLYPFVAAGVVLVLFLVATAWLSHRRKKREAKGAWPDDIEYR